MNFKTDALTDCWKVNRLRHNEQTHIARPRSRSAALKKLLSWLTIWFRVKKTCRRLRERSMKSHARQAFG